MNHKDELRNIKRKMHQAKSVEIRLPQRFSFKEHNVIDFENVLSVFDWTLENVPVRINLKLCTSANYLVSTFLITF